MTSELRVPFLDLGRAYAEQKEAIDAALLRVAASSRYLLGEELGAFEEEFAAFTGARHGVGVGSGLAALELALRATGVKPGDEVLVPSHTFIATWLAVSNVGAVPVAVEPDPATFLLDPMSVEKAVTPRTRAILPVHLYGRAADMTAFRAIASRHGLALVDDAAQAHGACHAGRPIGGWADATAWSFYPGKNLGALGDGGAVTTDDPAIADRVRLARNYGSRQKYVHETAGTNSRLCELQAAVLRVRLGALAAWNARRVALAERYTTRLAGLPLVTSAATLPGEHVFHLYVVRVAGRDAVQAALRARGVETLIHYPIPPGRQAAYGGATAGADTPVADALAREVLSLPMGPHLDAGDQDVVIDALARTLAKGA